VIAFRHVRVAALAAGLSVAASALSGCISLFPKAEPSQLYRFGDAAAPAEAAAAAADAQPAGVVMGPIGFPRAAIGDQILTVTGNEAAYIKGARWVAPASVLFQEDAERSFDRLGRRARLLQRGEIGAARALLRLDVRAFEADYAAAGAAPTVSVVVHASLSQPNGMMLDERTFQARQPAAENRVSAIVSAFDQATSQVLTGIVGWTDQVAPTAPMRDLGPEPARPIFRPGPRVHTPGR